MAPRLDPEAPNNPPATITYDIFQLAAGRTPASNLFCDNAGAVFYGAETKGVAPGYLGLIEPGGKVTEWAYGQAPISMIKDDKGRVWTADFEGTEIGRLVTRTNRLTTWDTGYTHLHGIAYQDSTVWTTSRDGYVLRFKPATGELRVFAMPNNTPLKHSLMDSQGRLWIAAGDQPGVGAAVFMFDKSTRTFTRYQIPVGFNPWGIREAADGALWFSNFNLKNQTTNSSAVARFDPATLEWTSFSGYPNPYRSTSIDWLGDKVIGVNILGDEFFLLDPAAAGLTNTVTKTTSKAVLHEVKTLTPSGQTLTPLQGNLTPSANASTGAGGIPYAAYPVPNPFNIHSLFGVKVCGSHVWMSGLLADQIYHFVTATAATPTATTTATPTLVQTRTPTPIATATATATPPLARTSTPTASPTPIATATATATPPPARTSTPTASPTPTPTPPASATLDLAPVADTTINLWNPDSNFGSSTALMVRPGFVSSLLRFDLSALPAGATISKAELSINTIGRTNEQALAATAYLMLRSWDESQATANLARIGQPWSAPLANGAGDHDSTALASATLATMGWTALDVTAAARTWLTTGPQGNFGLLLQATSADLVQYSLASREGWPGDQRPKLSIRYTLPAPSDGSTLSP